MSKAIMVEILEISGQSQTSLPQKKLRFLRRDTGLADVLHVNVHTLPEARVAMICVLRAMIPNSRLNTRRSV